MASKTNSSNFVFYFYFFLFSYTNTIYIAEVCLFSSISNTDICQCTDAALHAAYTRAWNTTIHSINSCIVVGIYETSIMFSSAS